jgi:hypothetical protein
MRNRNQGNRLNPHPILPTGRSFKNGVPAALGTRPQAVDVGAHSTQTMTPSQLHGALKALLNHLQGSTLMFPEVGRHRSGIGPTEVGVAAPTKRFIKVSMWLQQTGKQHPIRFRCPLIKRLHLHNPSLTPEHLQGTKAICARDRRWRPNAFMTQLDQSPWNPGTERAISNTRNHSILPASLLE